MNNKKGSGIVTVVVILAVVCIVFLVAGFTLLATWGGARFWEEIPNRIKNVEEFSIDQMQEQDINGITKFEFSSVSADMNIVYADTDTVTVVLKGTYRSSRGTAELKKEKIGNSVRIYVDYPKLSGIFNWSETDLTITMPKEMENIDLRFATVSGDIDIPSGLVAKDVNINSTSGDVKVSDIDCERVHYGNVSGRLDLDGTVADELRVDSVSGDSDINVYNEMEVLYVNTVSGDVDIYLNKNIEFKFEFSTVSGDFDCEFPIYESGGRNDRKGYSDENADMDIEVNTVSGDLRIRN